MLREFVKWDYELRHAEQVETVIDRALAIAKSEPQGPVYVTLPREILASDSSRRSFPRSPTIAPASPPAADPEALEEAAKLLGARAAPAAHHRERRPHRRSPRAPSSSSRRRWRCR